MTKQQKTTNFVFSIALLVGLVGTAYFAWKQQEYKKVKLKSTNPTNSIQNKQQHPIIYKSFTRN